MIDRSNGNLYSCCTSKFCAKLIYSLTLKKIDISKITYEFNLLNVDFWNGYLSYVFRPTGTVFLNYLENC